MGVTKREVQAIQGGARHQTQYHSTRFLRNAIQMFDLWIQRVFTFDLWQTYEVLPKEGLQSYKKIPHAHFKNHQVADNKLIIPRIDFVSL